MDESDVIVSSVEIIKDKLYFATLEGNYKPESTKNSKYFNIEDEIVYESFFFDYGPYHLCHLYFFCMKLNKKLTKVQKGKKVVFYTSNNKVHRLNAAYLIGSYAIIYLNKEPRPIYNLLTEGTIFDLLTFRDASGRFPVFEISLLDVFEGLHKAFVLGFFDFEHFNYQEYMFYEKVLNGDLNWIIPGKMLAFSGPQAQSKVVDDYPMHGPDHYHQYFKDNDVSTIVRLNQKSYNAKQFTEYGFEHYELFFLDGSVPSDTIVDKFNRICEKAKGAVAVHCKAGLGRTGTLIACYMMKHHDFTARQAISWLRICRPGSVIGFQQDFLIGIQSRMLAEGAHYRLKRNITQVPNFKDGIYSTTINMLDSDSDETITDSNISNSSLEDLENIPTVQSSKDHDNETSAAKVNNDFVSLDSIINSKSDTVATRSMTQKARASSALANAKNAYASNKNRFISNANNNIKPATVQVTYKPKKTDLINANVKSCSFSFSSVSPTKVALTKNQYVKGNLHNQRANLARNVNSEAGFKTFLKKSVATSDKLKKPDCNIVSTDTTNNMKYSGDRREIILRKKAVKSVYKSPVRQKNCNSDSDSIGTPATNMSADSLENIPCKMATRRDKSKSPERENVVAETTADPQGTRLCQIKASRKKFTASSFGVKNDNMKTRSYSHMSVAKKK